MARSASFHSPFSFKSVPPDESISEHADIRQILRRLEVNRDSRELPDSLSAKQWVWVNIGTFPVTIRVRND